MQTQDGKSGEGTKGGSWSVSDVTQPDAEAVTRAGPKTSSSKRKTGRTAKDADGKPKTTAKRKTPKAAKHDENKPQTTAKRKTSKTAKENDAKPKTTAKRRTSKTSKENDAKPKTVKRKTSKKETGKTTTKRRSRRKQDLGDLISQLLERRASGEKGIDSIVAAILEHLTKNMGLSSGAAELIVGYILNKLVKSKQEKGAAPGSGELDLGGFLGLTRSGQAIDSAPIASREELQELARDADLDPAAAEASLNQVLKMLGEAAVK